MPKNMPRNIALLTIMIFAPFQAFAENSPTPGTADSRVRNIVYNPRDVVNILGHFGYQTLVRFADYEQIENISIGDSLAWQVVPNERGNLLFLKPIEKDAETNLTVVTSTPSANDPSGVTQRIYVFALRAKSADHHNSSNFTWTVQFHYPQDDAALLNLRQRPQSLTSDSITGPSPAIDPSAWNFNYSFAGHRQQVPVKIFDNGTFTYFEFGDNTDTPAIFMVDADRNEALVNGVRQGKYVVVHRVAQQFTLRNGDVVTCIFNDSYESDPLLDQGSPTERSAALIVINDKPDTAS
ncbi:MAG: P-type conjugative transfer protein VirB9 [Gammaproteobacteria bacterium]|nr:MAG: P-type conjugative transfer protein VirB9 [Gammaproteobacteria bacterium]